MNAKPLVSFAIAASVVLATGCGSSGEGVEEEIPLAEVPPAVLEAARGLLIDVEWTSAEVEQEGDRRVYELEGPRGYLDVEVEVDENGEVLSVEAEDDRL